MLVKFLDPVPAYEDLKSGLDNIWYKSKIYFR